MSEKKNRTNKVVQDEQPKNPEQISRRDFLKIGVGVAAVAAGAVGVLGKLPISTSTSTSTGISQPANTSTEPIVATVDGDQLTVMNGQTSVKVKDRNLAGMIAEKLKEGN